MRVFQTHTFYKTYLDHFNARCPEAIAAPFEKRRAMLLHDRFMAAHILKPIHDRDPEAFFTVANDELLQGAWARENGLKTTNPKEILKAQVESHRAEVFYTLDPQRWNGELARQLSACVRVRIGWLGVPMHGQDGVGFDAMISNFEPHLVDWRKRGIRCFPFDPSHDPEMCRWGCNTDRPIDICFVGQYNSWLHTRRNEILKAMCELSRENLVSLRLMHRKWRPLAQSGPLARVPTPIRTLPLDLRRITGPPVFGLEMYKLFSQSKIVLNAHLDMAQHRRANMRCFEAMGCGACMLGDDGAYPPGFEPSRQFETYTDHRDLVTKATSLLSADARRRAMADQGRKFIETTYSKDTQWLRFREIVQNAV